MSFYAKTVSRDIALNGLRGEDPAILAYDTISQLPSAATTLTSNSSLLSERRDSRARSLPLLPEVNDVDDGPRYEPHLNERHRTYWEMPSNKKPAVAIKVEDDNEQAKSHIDTLYFWDGERKIDMVLAYEDDNSNDDPHRKEYKREVFQRNLQKQGLELELEPSKRSADRKTNFLKISAPWDILKRYAEILNLEMPIQEDEEEEPNMCGWMENKTPFDYDHDLIPPEPNFYTAGFLVDREDRFIIKDRASFFTQAQRSMIVWQILRRTAYDDNEPDKVGIIRLLSRGVYKAAFPLHDGRHDKDGPNGELCDRRLLYLEWGRPAKWYKKQPLWLIKRYFGDKIALYFAWLGFYTRMLVIPSILGVLVFLYGLATLKTDLNYPSKEICNISDAGGTWMCPNCEKFCDYWQLKKSCPLSKFTYTFDNFATVVFAIFMSFWATMFLELWKRRQAVIVWEWDLTNFEEVEQTRPEFEAKVKTTRINPVTKKEEPYLPPMTKVARVAFTTSFILLMVSNDLGGLNSDLNCRWSCLVRIDDGQHN